MKLNGFLLSLCLVLFPPILYGIEPNNVLDLLLDHEKLPRVLNSDDIPSLRPEDPQPLFAPQGDFNKDGQDDIAISGLYDLPDGGPRYFLLVATELKDPHRYQKLYFIEVKEPVYIHAPGTTGQGDPGDQAFSISFCANCGEGQDFYWNKGTRRFDLRPWTIKIKRIKKSIGLARPIPPEDIDKAIQIVSELPDIQQFTSEVKKRGGALGVRVNVPETRSPKNRLQVNIYEKSPEKEILYDSILVDVKKMKALKRLHKTKAKKER